jgi:hypothetical protein
MIMRTLIAWDKINPPNLPNHASERCSTAEIHEPKAWRKGALTAMRFGFIARLPLHGDGIWPVTGGSFARRVEE